MKIAASIVAVVGVGGLAYVSTIRMSTDEQRPESTAVSLRVDTTSTLAPDSGTERRPSRDQALLAARFVESPELEDLLRSPSRSSTTEVFSPANGATVRRNSLFRWETPAQPPFEIAILDNPAADDPLIPDRHERVRSPGFAAEGIVLLEDRRRRKPAPHRHVRRPLIA